MIDSTLIRAGFSAAKQAAAYVEIARRRIASDAPLFAEVSLCDWPLEGGGTCDAPVCPDHATEVGPDRHLFPLHAPRRDELPGQLGML